MRDLIVTIIIFGALPVVLFRPYLGLLLWSWIGYMNPHRLTWGFAYSFPFAAWIGAATLVGILLSKERKRFPWGPIPITLVIFVVWMSITTLSALNPDQAWDQWEKVMKIQLMIFITLLLLNSRERIRWLIWVIVASIGFYGIKGGIFTILTGGNYMVEGPGGFITGNTEIGLALIMTLPLMRFLQLTEKHRWVRRGLVLAMLLTAVAIIGTHSRGALLGVLAMGVFLWLKSDRKLLTSIVIALFVPAMLAFMPVHWFEKMHTIQTYEADSSAMGRINAWWFAFNLAKDRPLTGGGFETFTPSLFQQYAPNPDDFHAAHSIFFQVLGDHGFIGLAIFLTLGVLTWRVGSWVIRQTRIRDSHSWAKDLAAQLHVALVGYVVAGAFLSLAYFDLFYHLVAIMVALRVVVKRELEAESTDGQKATPSRNARGALVANVVRPNPATRKLAPEYKH